MTPNWSDIQLVHTLDALEKDKEDSLRTLNCTEQSPDTEIRLRDVYPRGPQNLQEFDIVLKTP